MSNFRPHKFTIRALLSDDAAAFKALRLRGLLECPSAFASSYEEELSIPLEEIELRLAPRTDAAIFGGFEDEQLLALVGVQREKLVKLAHKAFIWGMYVAPEGRGRKLGTLLLEHCLAYALGTLGVRQVNLGVNTKNAAAVALYRKVGFVQYGLERDFLLVDGTLHDEYQMVWRAKGAA